LEREAAKRLCDAWLPAWTGNRPEHLIGFYSIDAYYSDPAHPAGLRGRAELLSYFQKLLARNPDWTWTLKEVIPTSPGFVAKWSARIPVGDEIREVEGLDIVEVRDGKITRNEVYFDRSLLRSR
jgi:ketosteroid isomerase-like protein